MKTNKEQQEIKNLSSRVSALEEEIKKLNTFIAEMRGGL